MRNFCIDHVKDENHRIKRNRNGNLQYISVRTVESFCIKTSILHLYPYPYPFVDEEATFSTRAVLHSDVWFNIKLLSENVLKKAKTNRNRISVKPTNDANMKYTIKCVSLSCRKYQKWFLFSTAVHKWTVLWHVLIISHANGTYRLHKHSRKQTAGVKHGGNEG